MSKQSKRLLSFSPMFVLFLVFLALKLFKISPFTDLSYWWITSPLWIPVAFFLAILVLWFVAMVIVSITVLILE
jgi:hypothetical protein